jgi:hypothetical protein
MAELTAHVRAAKQRRRIRYMVARLGYRRHPEKTLAVVTARATAEDAGMVHYPRIRAK